MSAPPNMRPDDVFHVIIDALAIIAKMTPDDLARLNSGRPPWDWYDNLDDGLDPKVTDGGWRAVAAEAEKFAMDVLNNGAAENLLGEIETREAMRQRRRTVKP